MSIRNPAPRSAQRLGAWGFALAVATAMPFHQAHSDSSTPVLGVQGIGIGVARPATDPGQQATLLPDGRWLLTGGDVDGEPTNRIRVSTNSKIIAFPASLASARSGHSATVLPDGTVFIFGGTGLDGQVVSGAEIIDPLRGTVAQQVASGLTARTRHSATLLTGGQVLIAGGQDNSGETLSSVQLWDPRSQSVPTQSNLQVARSAHEAALLSSGEGLVWGGQNAAIPSLGSGEIYNPITNLFEGPVANNDARVQSTLTARTQPPLVAETLPQPDAVDVPLNSILAVRFSKALPIDRIDSKSVVLVGPSGALAGSVVGAEGGMLAFFTPAIELAPATTYTLFIRDLADQEGRALPSSSVKFTTHRIVALPGRTPSATPAAATAPAPATAASSSNASTEQGQKTTQAPVARTPVARQTTPDTPQAAMAEDWIPQAQNRHNAWRVLGLSNDPPLQIDARKMAALHAAANQTAIAGQVLRLNGLPLAGVAVTSGSLQATTDAQGRFLLSGLQGGAVEFKVDGTGIVNNGRHYTAHYLFVTAQNGTTTVLPYPIYLVRVDPVSEVSISSPAARDIILTHPSIPGLQVKIPKGAVIRDPDGKIVTKLSLTPIPTDRPPFPIPAPFSVYFTLQPAGAYVDGDPSKGVTVIYPNYQGAAAGTIVDFWNDDPSGKGWHVYGHGRVSPDQTQILPDPSVTFRELMHFSWATAPTTKQGSAQATGPVPNGCPGGDPVDCGSGIFIHNVTDLMVKDVIPISLTRMYRTNDNQVRAFGVGTDLSYGMRLFSPASSATSDQEIDIVQADGSRIQYFLGSGAADGRNDVYYAANSPTGFAGSKMWGDSNLVFLKDGTQLQFSQSAPYQLSTITDRHGNVVTITTAVNPNSVETQTAPPVTQVTSPNGRYIQFFYDSFNRVVSAVDSAGRSTSYAYDSQSHLISATDAGGHTEQYSYDPTTNNMSVVKDKRGNTATQNSYDANGRVSQQKLADGSIWKFSYVLNAAGSVTQTTVTDPRNYQSQHTFNAYGYPTQTTLAMGQPEQQTITTTYNAMNLPLQVTDELGRQTLYGYNSSGDLTSITALAGTANAVTYQMAYDPTFHQLSSITDPIGHTTVITIGPSGNAVAVADALGNSASAIYNAQGLVTSMFDPLGNQTQIGYGTAGNITSVTDPLNRKTQVGQDSLGRLVSIIDPLGNSTQFGVDAMDRLTSFTNAIGGNTVVTYDPNGNLLELTRVRGQFSVLDP